MDIKKAAVWDEFYRGLRANGWDKAKACEAAHRHIKQMSPRKLKQEVDRICRSLPPVN